MVLDREDSALVLRERSFFPPQVGQVLVGVEACAVCRTDLHVVDGELPETRLPIVPGHQVVGRVLRVGEGVAGVAVGERVGIPWLGSTCGRCDYCRAGQENLCDEARFTGCQIDGGFATHCVADARFVFALPDGADPATTAPLLCAGLIGYRALKLAGPGKRIGIFGFGAAAHLITQVAVWQQREIYAYTRPGDSKAQQLAREVGAHWAGGTNEALPASLDAAIIFAADGALVPLALTTVRKGGTVVCGGIHMSDIPAFPYRSLWGERQVRSVANLTRQDAREFLDIAPRVPVQVHVQRYAFTEANTALRDLREGRVSGAAVLIMEPPNLRPVSPA